MSVATDRSPVTVPPHVTTGASALVAAGVLFLVYPALRPWEEETTQAGATAAFAAEAWVFSHLAAVAGFVLLPFALFVLHRFLAGTRGERPALGALAATWAGVGLTLPYYGAEDFGLHTIGAAAADGAQLDVVALSEDFRLSAVPATTFALGLLLIAVGAVLAAVAVARSGRLPRWSAAPFALAFLLFLPQFFTPAPIRVAHGALVLIGCLILIETADGIVLTTREQAKRLVRASLAGSGSLVDELIAERQAEVRRENDEARR